MILQPTNGGRFLGGRRLPPEYQEVEWIRDEERRSYINTGMSIVPETGVLIRLMYSEGAYIAATRTSGVDDRFYLPYIEYDSFVYGYRSNYYTQVHPIYDSVQDVEINHMGSRAVKIDGETIGSVDGLLTCQFPLWLFGVNISNTTVNYGYCSTSKIFYYEMTVGNEIVQAFVPCYRISDGEIGMYDLCGTICSLTNSPFYINSGDGTFEKGSNIY